MWLFQRRNRDSRVQEEDMEIGFVGIALIVGLGLIWFWNSLYIIKEWERGVVLRLGRLIPEAKSAGINLVFWPIETLYRINMRIETLDVPPQDIITRQRFSEGQCGLLLPRGRRQPGAFAGSELHVCD